MGLSLTHSLESYCSFLSLTCKCTIYNIYTRSFFFPSNKIRNYRDGHLFQFILKYMFCYWNTLRKQYKRIKKNVFEIKLQYESYICIELHCGLLNQLCNINCSLLFPTFLFNLHAFSVISTYTDISRQFVCTVKCYILKSSFRILCRVDFYFAYVFYSTNCSK